MSMGVGTRERHTSSLYKSGDTNLAIRPGGDYLALLRVVAHSLEHSVGKHDFSPHKLSAENKSGFSLLDYSSQ